WGVDPNDVAVRIEERSAAVPGIDRGVCLDQAFERSPVFVFQAAIQRTYNSRRQGSLETERITDGENFLADYQIIGIAQMNEGQLLIRMDLQNCQIDSPIDADYSRRVLLLVRQSHRDVARSGDHVVVREDLAALVDNETRSYAFLGEDLEKHIALVDDTCDIYRRQMVGFLDVDVVLSVRRKTRTVGDNRVRPKSPAARQRSNQLLETPVPPRSHEPETRNQQQGENERSWSHDANLLKS